MGVVDVVIGHFPHVFSQQKAVLEHAVLWLFEACGHCHMFFSGVCGFGSFLEFTLDVSHLAAMVLKQFLHEFFAFEAVTEVLGG